MPGQLSLLGVSKSFGDVQALHDVTITVDAGEVHALVGENGAGKSTAVKILSGLERPTRGRILLDGAEVSLGSRTAAIREGIGLVPQQLSLIGDLTLAENFILTQHGRLARRGRAAALLRETAAIADLPATLDRPVRELGLAERQLGELTIALAQGARFLLLDEPTSALGPHESQGLFTHVRTLAAAGVGVVLITHRIDEVRKVADHVTVLSRGEMTLSHPVSEISDEALVHAMVGDFSPIQTHAAYAGGAPRLTVRDLSARGRGQSGIHGISLDVRTGEIVGVLGVAGNGQNVLADTVAGLNRTSGGSIAVDGVDVTGDAHRAARAGMAYVPEVRVDFLLPEAPLSASAVLRRLDERAFRRAGMLRWSRITDFARGLIARHDVRPADPTIPAGSLSGGNQQKLLVGRELDGAPAVAVLHGPTQGLDLAAASAIRNEILSAAAAGTAVLLISADIDEVRELADRIVVVSRGRIVDELDAGEFDVQRIGRAMAGLGGGQAAA